MVSFESLPRDVFSLIIRLLRLTDVSNLRQVSIVTFCTRIFKDVHVFHLKGLPNNKCDYF